MGRTPVERTVAMAIKNDITIYSAHTNMDSAWQGVSFRMADKIGMTDVQFLDENPVAPYGDQESSTAGCGVIGNIRKEGQVLLGSPCIPTTQYMRAYAKFRQSGQE